MISYSLRKINEFFWYGKKKLIKRFPKDSQKHRHGNQIKKKTFLIRKKMNEWIKHQHELAQWPVSLPILAIKHYFFIYGSIVYIQWGETESFDYFLPSFAFFKCRYSQVAIIMRRSLKLLLQSSDTHQGWNTLHVREI